MKNLKLRIAGGTAAVAAVLGGGAAVAATQLSPAEESDAIVADAAEQLGVSAARLDAALKQALKNRVDAAVAAGRITQAQGTELKQRIDAGEVPLVGVGPGHGGHRGGPGGGGVALDAAAEFLGLTDAQLRERVQNGATLAEIATAEGKTPAGLVDALVAAAKAHLDEEVQSGEITPAERTERLEGIEARIEDAVNGEIRFGRGHDGPHPDDADDA